MMKPQIADVRLAGPADVDRLYELVHLLHAENGMLPTDEDLIRELLVAFTSHKPTEHCPNPGVGAVIEKDGKLVAVIALRVNQLWYSRQPFLEELFVFVHPEHRRSYYAKSLVAYAKFMADDLGLPLLIGVLSTIRTEAKVRLYRRMLPFTGAFFLYRGDEHHRDKVAA